MSNSPQFSTGQFATGQGGAANPFADQMNPYAAPQQQGGYAPAPNVQPLFAGMWRQGNVLVVHKAAPLPDICLKSNTKATRRLLRSLSWHHPAIFILVFVSPLIYIIVALIVRKTATIQMPLSEEWYARRRQRMAIAWSIVLASVVLFFLGIFLADQVELAPLLAVAAIFGLLGAAIYGLIACRLITPQRITDEYVWIKGAHPDFLNRLEVWQWNI